MRFRNEGSSRRDFLRRAAAGAAEMAFAAPGGAGQGKTAQAKGTGFKLKYAPGLGLFAASAGKSPADQLKFMADQGFSAWFDNGLMCKPPAEQEALARESQRLGLTIGPFVVYADFSVESFVIRDAAINDMLEARFKTAVKYAGYEDYIFEPVIINGVENLTLHAEMVPLPTVSPTPQPATDQAVTIQATATQAQNAIIIVQTQSAAATTPVPDTASSGSLSVTTTPAGAEIFIDNVMKGVSPVVLAGLSPGTHSLGIVKQGYRNISTTITIEAGKTLDYSTGLIATAQSPGFSAVLVCAVLFGFLIIRKRSG